MRSWALLLMVLGLGVGCAARYVTRGADLYAGGHYIEAAEVFERTEQRLPDSSFSERARYGLYRGATLLALGDAARGVGWLSYSSEILRKEPSALNDEERVMLGRALALAARESSVAPAAVRTDSAVASGRALVPAAELGN